MKFDSDLLLQERALDAIEQREAKLLVWGIVDAFLTESEIRSLLRDVLAESDDLFSESNLSLDTDDRLLRALLESALVFELPDRRGFRSRMAESVRLMARLRQLFPKHAKDALWLTAPTLVSDFRFTWRRRRYPCRNIDAQEAIERIGGEVENPHLLEALKHLLGSIGPHHKLAVFQLDATSRILSEVNKGLMGGTLVGAGTGSGKTLAFYIPALSWLASEVAQEGSASVRILALYPRNELLKDQFAEVYSQCRHFDQYLAAKGKRKLSIGVLYGDTPYSAGRIMEEWKAKGAGYVCPYLPCPDLSCEGSMIAQKSDLLARRLRLVCSSCGIVINDDEIYITREQLKTSPPDILFTTVEMMNQRLADSEMRHVFGVGPVAKRVPRLVLLDEVHIYGGTYGAQVAFLIRRWRYLTKYQSSFVGLSATLAGGLQFFSNLTGLDESTVVEITPRPEELVSEGGEYLLALRGDPVSRSSLLSTSIQTALLASRILDPRDRVHDRPFHGWRTFAFTDQVDAANRLFYDLRDAEGFDKQGRINVRKHPNGGLAHLRTPVGSATRFDGGQDWSLAAAIGHDLGVRHAVERTTSYDKGVSTESPVVVATAALEVGYDDPQVGVVIQHKAPRDVAQFLQRKGRAGRTRHMRPWTIVVLSDYGRDRIAYLAYDQLFDPEVPGRSLPLVNRYIRRIQATYALIDYLGVRTQVYVPPGSVWRDLTRPFQTDDESRLAAVKGALTKLIAEMPAVLTQPLWRRAKAMATAIGQQSGVYPQNNKDKWEPANYLQNRLRQTKIIGELSQLLSSTNDQERFGEFLRSALFLNEAEVTPLLWEHPRPILLGAVPTALRRLSSDWQSSGVPLGDFAGKHPLPEFIPANLFSDLNLPEVKIERFESTDRSKKIGYLPVLQALDELAPGKVSKRFDEALWLGPQTSDPTLNQPIEISEQYELDPQPMFSAHVDGQRNDYSAFRPVAMKLRAIPKGIKETTNARLEWDSQIFANQPGLHLDVPNSFKVCELISAVNIHTHAGQSPATVRRYARSSTVRFMLDGRELDSPVHYDFVHQGQPCGVGFEIETDAIVVTLRLPDDCSVAIDQNDERLVRAIRSERFYWEARHHEPFDEVVPNVFRRDWLAQVFISAVSMRAAVEGVPLEVAIREIGLPENRASLLSVLGAIFQSPYSEEETDETDERVPDRLRVDLENDLNNSEVIEMLQILGRVLVSPIDNSWHRWLKDAIKNSLAGALLVAIQDLCPELSVDALIVDTEPGPHPDAGEQHGHRDNEIWITESSPGGNGLIENFMETYVYRPEKFFSLVEAALGASEFEIVDQQMQDLLSRLGGASVDEELRDQASRVRYTKGVGELFREHEMFRHKLIERGFSMFHSFASAIGNRLLRPDTPEELDNWMHRSIEKWKAMESAIGVEFDARLVAYLLSDDDELDMVLAAAGFVVPATNTRVWRFNAVYGLLWARGYAVRSSHLQFYSRFSQTTRIFERLLVQPWLTPEITPISIESADWRTQLLLELATHGRAGVEVSYGNSEGIRLVIAHISISPVQLEYLNLYGRISAVRRREQAVVLEFELPEAA